jgi:hypothetical protein
MWSFISSILLIAFRVLPALFHSVYNDSGRQGAGHVCGRACHVGYAIDAEKDREAVNWDANRCQSGHHAQHAASRYAGDSERDYEGREYGGSDSGSC